MRKKIQEAKRKNLNWRNVQLEEGELSCENLPSRPEKNERSQALLKADTPFSFISTGSWRLLQIAIALNYRRKGSHEISAEVHSR